MNMSKIKETIKNIDLTLRYVNIPKKMREALERKKVILETDKIVEK